MENQKFSLQIPCPLHPNEFIQRANDELTSGQQLFCLECILSNEDDASLSSKLKTIPDLINTAADFYARNKQSLNLGSQVPAEYLELVSGQGEKLEKLSKHIEIEKKKASDAFDTIMKDTVKMISEKKNEYLNTLDQQLFNLRYWYIFFDKQLKKAFPSEEDIPFLFPTKEDLTNKVGKITNATQLTAFVRNLKEDLNEHKIIKVPDDELVKNRKTFVQNLNKKLVKVEKITPYYKEGELNLSGFKNELQDKITGLLNRLLVLESSIQDVVSSGNYDSRIVKSKEFEMIRQWLPKSTPFNPKLIYQARKHGFSGGAFHEHCDGKANTITLVKAQFNGSSKVFTVGGFMDQPWNTSNDYIYSDNAFIFSISSKTKCPVTNQSEAGYGAHNQGPTFGGGHDLGVFLAGCGTQCCIYPNSYNGTSKLLEGVNSNCNYEDGENLYYFEALEVEVYSL